MVQANAISQHTKASAARVSIVVIAAWTALLSCAPQGDYPAPALGVLVDRDLAVVNVLSASAAEQAGVQVGDVLVALNGTAYTRRSDWLREVSKIAVGQKYDLTIQRAGQLTVLSVTSARPTFNSTPGSTPTPWPTGAVFVWLPGGP